MICPTDAARLQAVTFIAERRDTLTLGTYIYGDFCSGEIFTGAGPTQLLGHSAQHCVLRRR
ncbi:MAG: hypothetical protein WKF71_12230 [Pyrinomonadaceae bacterium]